MNAEKWHKKDAVVIELSFISLIKDARLKRKIVDLRSL